MNERERFIATMHYQERDRAPIMDFGFWTETLPEWYEQGLPDWVVHSKASDFFGMDGFEKYLISNANVTPTPSKSKAKLLTGRGVGAGLVPGFEEKVLEDRGDEEVVQQSDGVCVVRSKIASSIPQHEGHLLTDRDSWNKHYAPRLDPSHPDRLPEDWDKITKHWADPNRDYPLFVPGGSLFGWIRNWMGIEAVSYVVYDDPAFFQQMVDTIADCVVGTLERVLQCGVQFEACSMWEDMCYNAGPLLSPQHFEQYLVPQYKRITELLRRHGVDVIYLDCDGNIDALLPLWLDAGVNCQFPIEVGTWGADPITYRKQYGKDLLMFGGFDKHILATTKEAIEREVHRLTPLVEEGGYIPLCDHRVPPDVSLENYMHYVRTARQVWGKNTNLNPMHPEAVAI